MVAFCGHCSGYFYSVKQIQKRCKAFLTAAKVRNSAFNVQKMQACALASSKKHLTGNKNYLTGSKKQTISVNFFKKIMDNTLYITPNEAARILGVSRQTIYNRVKTDWKDFYRELGGRMYVSVAVLPEGIDLTSVEVVRLTDEQSSTSDYNENKGLSQAWDGVVSELRDIIAAQRQEIADLREQLSAERSRAAGLERRLGDYAERFADLAIREQELTRNAQSLHALSGAHEASGKVESHPKKKGFLWGRRNADTHE